jgi:hypothetical protein
MAVCFILLNSMLKKEEGAHSKRAGTSAGVLSVDQKMAVLSAVACGTATTSRQPKPDAEPETDVSE